MDPQDKFSRSWINLKTKFSFKCQGNWKQYELPRNLTEKMNQCILCISKFAKYEVEHWNTMAYILLWTLSQENKIWFILRRNFTSAVLKFSFLFFFYCRYDSIISMSFTYKQGQHKAKQYDAPPHLSMPLIIGLWHLNQKATDVPSLIKVHSQLFNKSGKLVLNKGQ